MRLLLSVALLLTLGQAVQADQPLLRPSRDVDITYRALGPGQPEQRVRWLATAQTMRIDPPGQGLYVIIDYLARRMSVVREATRSVVDMAAPNSAADAIGGGGGTGYVRRGQATVAGLACTEWQTKDRDDRAVVLCLTGDGVLLRAGTPAQDRVSAVAVRYAPQDPAAFRVPAGYTHRSAGAAR